MSPDIDRVRFSGWEEETVEAGDQKLTVDENNRRERRIRQAVRVARRRAAALRVEKALQILDGALTRLPVGESNSDLPRSP